MIAGRLSRFTVISGVGWLIDVATMLGLVAAGAAPFLANLVGAVLAVTFVFVLAQRRVFTSVGAGGVRWRLFGPYLGWQAVAIPAASALIAALAALLAGPAAWLAATLPATASAALIAAGVAKVAVTPLTLVANFAFSAWLMERRADRR